MEIVKIYVFGFARIISHTRRSFLELMHVPNCLGNCTYLKYYIMKVDHYLPQGCPKYYTIFRSLLSKLFVFLIASYLSISMYLPTFEIMPSFTLGKTF